jgi:hypothetical protein
MVRLAAKRNPGLHFLLADAHELPLSYPFDVVILSDLLNDLWDVQVVLEEVRKLCHPRTRILLNVFSRLWEAPLSVGQLLGVVQPRLRQNWLTSTDCENLLRLSDFEVIRRWTEVLCPIGVPLLWRFADKYLGRLWPFRHLALANFLLARPSPSTRDDRINPTVSVVIPARNEEGNIPQIFSRVPEMGGGTELVFVEGHSRDGTYAAIEGEISRNPGRRSLLLRQAGTGKGDAVRLGFEKARGEVLMILDADLTVPPESLPRFYEALRSGKGEFVNGVRLVYPMEREAMRFINLLGNKFFSGAFSWILGQPLKDTLCGTKVLWKRDYERIRDNRAYFGDFDPFGDFDLIFGAAKLGLKIVDLPVRYRDRTYGETNIQRWKHGWLLLRMVAFAAFRIKFV